MKNVTKLLRKEIMVLDKKFTEKEQNDTNVRWYNAKNNFAL
jgi:hypothetical protein